MHLGAHHVQVATIFTALLEGLAVRRVVQPERVPAELFGDVVLALLPVLLRAEDDDRTLDDLVKEIDSYPTARRVRPSGTRQ